MNNLQEIRALLPACYQVPWDLGNLAEPEEVRLGVGRPLRVLGGGREAELWPAATQTQVAETLQRACRHSAYAHLETLRQGYITLEGGHRIGVCGFGVVQDGQVQTIREPTSLAIRVARAVPGCAETLLSQLRENTLLLGPPGAGKTTLLRDAVRLLSDRRRRRVGLADERGEVSAATAAGAMLPVGQRTDVLVGVPKAEAVMMLLRTMGPEWIALDEITAPADIEALERAAYCGVKLLATAHGGGMEDLCRRPLYRRLLDAGIFSQAALLQPDKTYALRTLVGAEASGGRRYDHITKEESP